MQRTVLLLLCAAGAVHLGAAKAACDIHPLALSGHVATGSSLSFMLGDGGADWSEGAITVLNGGRKVCTTSSNVSYINSIQLTNSGLIYALSEGGSWTNLFLVDPRNCSTLWDSGSLASRKSVDLVDPRISNTAISFGIVGADEKLRKNRFSIPLGPDCVPASIQPISTRNARVAVPTQPMNNPSDAGYRWTSGYGQGTSESSIISTDSSTVFRIYCADGQSPPNAGIELSSKAGRPIADGTKNVQITVADKTIQIEISAGLSVASAMFQKNDLINLVSGLAAARTGYFTVAIPEINWAKQFSIAGARSVLLVPTPTNKVATVIDACVQP